MVDGLVGHGKMLAGGVHLLAGQVHALGDQPALVNHSLATHNTQSTNGTASWDSEREEKPWHTGCCCAHHSEVQRLGQDTGRSEDFI